MAIGDVVIDTNAYAAFKRGESAALSVVEKVNQILINPVVIAELLTGFSLGNRESRNIDELKQFLANQNVVSVRIGYSTAEFYASIIKQLRKKGKPIPTNDIWIGASALEYEANIFTFDRHFNDISGITIVGRK